MRLIEKIKRDTIKARKGYVVKVCRDKKTGEGTKVRAVYDGDALVMFATRLTAGDFIENVLENECFELCEVFTTESGLRYIYWRDNELDEDYLTLITDALTAFAKKA